MSTPKVTWFQPETISTDITYAHAFECLAFQDLMNGMPNSAEGMQERAEAYKQAYKHTFPTLFNIACPS
jgi:hypothetical protein